MSNIITNDYKATTFLDLDGIVADCESKFVQLHNKEYGTNYTKEDIFWDEENYGCLNDHEGKAKRLEDFLETDRFFVDLAPLPGGVNAVKELNKLSDLYIVSAPSRNIDSATDKLGWVMDVLNFSRKKTMLCKQKWFLRGDEKTLFIDDWGSNVTNFRRKNPRSFIATIAYPYNNFDRTILDVRAEDRLNTEKAWNTLLIEIEKYISTL